LHQALLPWLYKIALHECEDELKRVRRQKSLPFGKESPDYAVQIGRRIIEGDVSLTDGSGPRETQAILWAMLDWLSDGERIAIVLRDHERIPYPQIAEIMNCAERVARLKVYRARTKLKSLINSAE
jgi:RNA polymerase sigma-70 factor (ECF subfamily)